MVAASDLGSDDYIVQVQVLSPLSRCQISRCVYRMPQTNLFFFEGIAFGMIFFYLGGYFIFFKYFLGRIILLHKTRGFLAPLMSGHFFCPLGTQYDFYLESSLFVVLVTLLLTVIVRLVWPTDEFNPSFVMVNRANPYSVQQQMLLTPAVNLVILFDQNRDKSYYRLACLRVNEVTLEVINLMNNNVIPARLANLYRSFTPQVQSVSKGLDSTSN